MADRHVDINREYWNATAADWIPAGERLWAGADPEWGIWGLPEAELGLLPPDMSGMRALELGCGTGYVSGWMARRGAQVTGVDLSAQQLATARRLARAHGTEITFVEGNAEALDLPDNSFDFAISEHGAAIWCDPDLWLREAWRVLRRGGRLVFLGNHPLAILCTPRTGADCEDRLHRPYRDLGRVDWTDVEIEPGGIEFNRTTSGWLRLFHDVGFEVAGYQELHAPTDAEGTRFGIPAGWATRHPAEQVWTLDKRA